MRRLLTPQGQSSGFQQPQNSFQAPQQPSKKSWSITKAPTNDAMSTGVLGEANRNTQKKGWGILGDIAKSVGGEIAKTAVQLPRAFVAGVAGATGNQEVEKNFSKPINVPVLGEVKGLSANPADVKRYETQTAEETAGQAVGMAGEALAFTGVGGSGAALESGAAVPTGLKIAQGMETGVAFGGLGGASSALEQNESAQDVISSTAKGAAIGGLTGGATVAGVEGGKALAGKMSRVAVTRMIKPIASMFKFGKDPVGAFIDEGFQGNNIHEIADQVVSRKNEVGAGIDAVIQKAEQANPTKTINATDAVSAIDEQIKKSAYSPDDIAELKRVRGMLTDVRDVQNGESTITGQRNLASLKPSEAQQIKRIIGDNASWSSKASNTVNSFTKKLYGILDGKITEAVPEAAELNSRYGNLLSLNKATQRAIEQKMAKEGRGDVTDILSAGAGVAALIHGDFALAGEIAVTDLTRKLVDSPAVASRLAGLLQKASESDLSKLSSQYPGFAKVLKTVGRDELMKMAESASEKPKTKPRKLN